MIKAGVVSVSFRKLSPREIINLAKRAGLQGIEWGGDIHVPHGDLKCAREVSAMTKDSGLDVASYGSYYYAGCESKGSFTFEQVLETALMLHAPGIRIWAGDKSSAETDPIFRYKVVEDTRRIADIAQKASIKISFEYHSGTLTDSVESTIKLMEAIDHPNVNTYWQPPIGFDVERNTADLTKVLPWITNLHVYYWKEYKRLPLEEGLSSWRMYMDIIKKLKKNRYCMIEFVMDDNLGQFMKDAEVLKKQLLEPGSE